MARLFTKTNTDVINLASLPYLSTAISVSFWYKNATNPAAQPNAFGVIQRSLGDKDFNYIVYQNQALISMSYSKAFNSFVNSYFLLSPDNGVWHHACISSNFSTDCQWYFDGASQSVTVDAAAGTPENVSTWQTLGNVAGGNNFRNGALADVALWNVKLTAGEAIALSKGVRPCFIRPTALQGYWPLDGIQSLEPDLSGNARNGTLSGTAYANGPPMMMFTPRWPRNYDPVTVTTVPLSQTHFRFRTDTGAVDATPTWGDAEDAA